MKNIEEYYFKKNKERIDRKQFIGMLIVVVVPIVVWGLKGII